jgi:hypothetical protein
MARKPTHVATALATTIHDYLRLNPDVFNSKINSQKKNKIKDF